MNIIRYVKSTVALATVMLFSSAIYAGGSSFPLRIDKQVKAVEAARKAKEINFGESESLKKEIAAIKKLYQLYWKDKSISAKEAKTLNSKLSSSDVNLFRKKYD